jgi:hypothetical protein
VTVGRREAAGKRTGRYSQRVTKGVIRQGARLNGKVGMPLIGLFVPHHAIQSVRWPHYNGHGTQGNRYKTLFPCLSVCFRNGD